MLNIFICEDEKTQRNRLEAIVNKHLISDDFYMKLALSADNPFALLTYLKTHRVQSGLYLLDIGLESEINGIELAVEIKEIDVSATIVFITTHSEMMHHTFKLKVEAMEFILKDHSPEEIEQRVIDCMQVAYKRFLDGKHSSTKYFPVKIGNQHFNIAYNDILFAESKPEQPNKVFLHKLNGTLEYYGTLYAISDLGLPFFNCHRSIVVNVNHIKSVDSVRREAKMTDGTIIPVAKRKMAEVLKNI